MLDTSSSNLGILATDSRTIQGESTFGIGTLVWWSSRSHSSIDVVVRVMLRIFYETFCSHIVPVFERPEKVRELIEKYSEDFYDTSILASLGGSICPRGDVARSYQSSLE